MKAALSGSFASRQFARAKLRWICSVSSSGMNCSSSSDGPAADCWLAPASAAASVAFGSERRAVWRPSGRLDRWSAIREAGGAADRGSAFRPSPFSCGRSAAVELCSRPPPVSYVCGRWPMLSPKAVSGDYACPA
eukprot:7177403-Prymnesium_polylepis.1